VNATVNASNNKFYFGNNAEITIPEGSYEIQAINEFLNRAILRKHLRPMIHSNDEKKRSDDEDEEYPLMLRANYSTMKNEIKYAYNYKL